MKADMSEFDSPWKEALDRWFAEFLALFLPEAFREIDWSRGVEFLDAELRQVLREAETGSRLVDRLARVWLLDGTEEWVLIHLEVQSQTEPDFARRLFVCHYRIHDMFGRPPVTLAVLGDDRAGWRPDGFSYQRWGCEVAFRFPAVKLLDFQNRWDELATSHNPFATVVMAHLKSIETRGRSADRLAAKLAFVRNLYSGGWSREDVLELFRVIDWFLELSREMELIVRQEVTRFEEEHIMPYVTSIERMAREEGLEEGLEKGLEKGRDEGRKEGRDEGARVILCEILTPDLLQRFGDDGVGFAERLAGLDVDQLLQLRKLIIENAPLDDIRKVI